MQNQKGKKQFDVVTIGGATRDIMFYSGDGKLITTNAATREKLLAFEYGAKITADKLYFSYGGGATNTAVTFSALGLKTAVVCRVGQDDNGREIIKNLKERDIDVSYIRTDRKDASGFSVILSVKNESREHVVFGYRGANNLLSGLDVPLSQLDTDWFCVSALPKDTWEGIMKKLITTNKNIVWNPGGYQLKQLAALKKYLPKIKLLILNHNEALEFKKLKDIKGLLKYIKDLGSQLVVITDGSRGAYVYDGKKYYFMKAKSSKSVDTVGVGDAFSSAFTSALIYGKNIRTALEWGIKNSASVVSKIGAQNGILTKKQISR